ncbi:uncharacterized protein FYW47_013965 [Aplochiton taeniatus]
MAGRRGCVNSMWSGTERVRIGERLKATLAGVLELDLLRCQHLERIDAALDNKDPCIIDQHEEVTGSENLDSVASNQGSATSRRQQVTSPSDTLLGPGQSSPLDSGGSSTGDGPDHSRVGGGGPSRWSTLSWDAPSDILSPPTPDPDGAALLDCDSRPSSGFYSVSGSSLSDSCYSVSSEAALGVPGGLARPLRLWEQRPHSADHSDTQWSEQVVRKQAAASSDGATETGERRPVSTGDLEANGLSFLSDLCSSLCDPVPSYLLPLFDPSSSPRLRPQLDPRFCTDLVSRRTKEVYPYPSPLHAVALQSPLFNSLSSSDPSPSPSPDSPQPDEPPTPNTTTTTPGPLELQPPQPPASPSLTQLEQYITRLVRQHHSRMASTSCSDLTPAATPGPACHRGLRTPAKSHGSTQSLSAFESRSTPSTLLGGGATPCKSLLGNSARVSLSSIGKRASRNSINLGNLPSATGEDLNISLHLNLNLNLAPGFNASLGLVDNPQSSGVSGPVKSDFGTGASMASSTSLTASTPTPGLRPRPRISTCPTSLSHRSSMEVTGGSGAGAAFSRSLDWGGASPGVFPPGSGSGCGPVQPDGPAHQDSGSSLKVSEDSAMVGEISRLSGLPRAVVVGLMEQGVELDVDCFQSDADRRGQGSGVEGRSSTQTEPQHEYSRVHLHVGSDQNPSRPIQLSLSVTPSPQSHSGLTPPLSHSPLSHSPLSHSPLSQASSSPIPSYQSAPIPTHRHSYSHYQHYQQSPSPSDFPSSTASSPASRPGPRVRSPPRPLQPSPLGSTPLSVFRRDAPSQCSLPRVGTCGSPLGGAVSGCLRSRGGSLRQGPVGGGGGGGGGGGWRRADGEGLYQGKHASRELVRASTISSFARRESAGSTWGKEVRTAAQTPGRSPKKTPSRLWKGFEGRFWGKEEDSEKEEDGWRRESEGSRRKDHQRVKEASGSRAERECFSTSSSKRKGRSSWDKRSSSLRLSRRALFRSESQGLLEPRAQREEPLRGPHWASSLDVGRFGLELHSEQGVSSLGGRRDGQRLSSTASLFHLSRSQSLEGSCHSLSSPPLSSPSFSPSPPPRAPLTRSHSLRDLGRRVFGSMRSLSLKHKTTRK